MFSSTHKNPKWYVTMLDEFPTSVENHTWDLISLSSTCNAIGYKRIYKIKQKPSSSVDRIKACLLAWDFNQCERINSDETFSLVVKSLTIQTILSIVVFI